MTYRGPQGDLTIVIEKMDADRSQCERGARNPAEAQRTAREEATFLVPPDVSRLSVFRSDFGSNPYSTQDLFLAQPDLIADHRGRFTLVLKPNHAYTLSTLRSGRKGTTSSPAVKSFPMSYSENFDTCPLDSIPKYLAPMAGSFDCVNASGGRQGRSLRQASPEMSICDRGDVMPYLILGDGFRTRYNITVEYLLPEIEANQENQEEVREQGVFIGARAKGAVGDHTGMDGIFIALNNTGYRVALTIGNLTLTSPHLISQG